MPRAGSGLHGRCVTGQEHPGQRDVLELAQVAEVVLSRQALLTRPAEGFAQPPLRDPHPRLQRRDRAHVRGEVARVPALGLVEQSSAPSRSPCASRMRAMATRQRYGYCGTPVCSPSSWLVSRCWWRRPDRSAHGASSLRPTCMSAVPRRTGAPVLRPPAAVPARRCASPRAAGPARSGYRPG